MNAHQYALQFQKLRRYPKGRVTALARKSAMTVRAEHKREIIERRLEIGAAVRLYPENITDEIECFTPWNWVKLRNKQVPVPPKDLTRID